MGWLAPTSGGGGGAGGAGDVVGPGSATDNAVALFDGTTGEAIEDSVVTITDAGAIANVTTINGTTIPSSKTLVVTTDKLSVHAATTSLEFKGVISDETGSGAVVFADTPTLVTPVLGTPTSGTLTNCTIPVGGVSGLAANVAAFLADPTSAKLATALTDETGSGLNVHQTSPTIITPTIAKIANLTTNGVLTTTGADGTLVVGNREIPRFITYSATEIFCYQGGAVGRTASGVALVANRLYAVPWTCPVGLSVIRDMTLYVTTGVASTNARFALYEDTSGLPGAMVANTDSGNQSTASSATARTFTPGATVTLTSGKTYWMAIFSDGAPTLLSTATPHGQLGHDMIAGGTAVNTGFYIAKTFGAPPDPFGADARTWNTTHGLFVGVRFTS